MNNLILNGRELTINNIKSINLPKKIKVGICPKAKEKMIQANDYVKEIVESGEAVYGINTGFGALADKRINKEDLSKLQYNLIRSHCTGVGNFFSKDITRAAMLIRANCLCSGFSGINPYLVEMLLNFINLEITPRVPEKGSVGASGDLAPLSHIALCLIGEGEVEFQGSIEKSSDVIKKLNLTPCTLGAKDGLSLINGTAVMAALESLALIEARKVIKLADITTAITLESVKGSKKAYDQSITRLKPHPGQVECVKNLNKILEDSEITESHLGCNKVQDPYSLRCVPQVHGAIRQTINHAEEVLNIELNSVTDNPLVFVDEKKVVSGGNFHGEALALSMDYLAMGVSEIANISERRIEKMMNPTFSDLPAFLIESSGLNSGLMIAHVTAAALASENKYLCHPASVDSIPTSTDKEDHVSMGVTAGLKLQTVIENTKNCLAIELLCACQALEFQRPLRGSRAVELVHQHVRKKVKPLTEDRVLSEDIKNIYELISKEELTLLVEERIGELH
jgi:histidine ammonia-lyase